MTPDTLARDYIAGAKFFHLSAIGQAISETARATCDAAIAAARAAGVKVSYDTNLRLRLWDLDTARRKIDETIALCDIALPSLDNSQQLTGLTATGRDRRLLPEARRAPRRAQDGGRRLDGRDRHARVIACRPIA